MGFRPQRIGLALVAALLGAACSTSQLDFRQLPSAELLASIRPGVSTRSEVLQRLGPPEELRRPATFDRARPITPQHRRVLEEGQVFGHDAYTYASASRRTTSLALIPGGPSVLEVSNTRFVEHLWRIEFDAEGVVRSVSHVDETKERK